MAQKLYTEEQLRKAIKLAQKCEHDCGGVYFYCTETEIIEELTPIELPSDEEIEDYSYKYSLTHEDVTDKLGKYLVSAAHIDGAKWLKEQILNQNK